MQSYVINLDRCPDRLQSFRAQAERFELTFERLSAVVGVDLPADYIAQVKSQPPEFQPIDTGNIGLTLSHRQYWQCLVDSGAPHAAIFEDDVILAPTIAQTLQAIDQQQPQFDIIKLETTLRKVVCRRTAIQLASGDSLQQLLSWHGGTAGYVLSRHGAQRLLQQPETSLGIVDQTLFHPFARIASQLRILQLRPAACIQSQFLSAGETAVFASTLGKPSTNQGWFRYGLGIDTRRLVRRQVESLRRRRLAGRAENEQFVVPFRATNQSRRAA